MTNAASPGVRRTLRLDLEFDGTDFEGWQRQAQARTVQGEVETALARILGGPHAVVGCGRTDAGVHARAMVASFRTTHAMAAPALARALDAVLPPDIGVRAVTEAAHDFHARRDALWKWYRYTVLLAARKRPLERRTAWRLRAAPALEALEAATAPLEGRHDFRSFANLGSTPTSTVRTLHALRWQRADGHLLLDAVGDGFLYKMVRTLVGTLLAAAAEPDPAAAITGVLEARDRAAAGAPAPARGLCLMAVGVRGEATSGRVPEILHGGVDLGVHRPMGGSH